MSTTQRNNPPLQLRCSLRTLFLLMLVLCIPLGWTVNRATKQRNAVQWVQKMGGRVYYDYEVERDGDLILGKPRLPAPKWLIELLGIDYFDEVVSVGLSGNHVRDLAPLAALTNVRRLDLYYTSVSDLSPLKGLTKMKTLHLYGAPLSDLSPLLGMSDLRGAGLSDTLVSDLSPLVGMERMQVLQLNGTCVSNLSPLSAMTEMLFLELVETRVSDLTPLASMNKVIVGLGSLQNVTVPPNFKGRIQRRAAEDSGSMLDIQGEGIK